MRIEYMKNVINYFANKYKYNWEDIYTALKSKEQINKRQLDLCEFKENTITIIDENFPNNFKNIYMPPLIFFYKGNNKIWDGNNEIVSIWDSQLNDHVFEVIKNRFKNGEILSFLYNNKYDDFYNKLSASNIKIILSSNTQKPSSSLNINENVCFISEVDFNCMNPSIDIEQYEERICFGISSKSIMIKIDIDQMKKISSLFELEKRSITIIDEMNEAELELIKNFKFIILLDTDKKESTNNNQVNN